MKRLRVFIPYLAVFAAIALPIAISAQTISNPAMQPSGVIMQPLVTQEPDRPVAITSIQRLAKILGLTEDQQKAITDLQERQQKQVSSFFQEQASLSKELETMMLSSTPDLEKIKEITRQIYQLRNNTAEAGVVFWIEIRTHLTEEQNQRLIGALQNQINLRPMVYGYSRVETSALPQDFFFGLKMPSLVPYVFPESVEKQ